MLMPVQRVGGTIPAVTIYYSGCDFFHTISTSFHTSPGSLVMKSQYGFPALVPGSGRSASISRMQRPIYTTTDRLHLTVGYFSASCSCLAKSLLERKPTSPIELHTGTPAIKIASEIYRLIVGFWPAVLLSRRPVFPIEWAKAPASFTS